MLELWVLYVYIFHSPTTLNSNFHCEGLGYMGLGFHWTALRSFGEVMRVVERSHLHWVPMPMPIHTHGFWVGMGGHGWTSVLCIPASNSKLESNFSDVGNMLTNERSGLKLAIVNGLLSVRFNQDLV